MKLQSPIQIRWLDIEPFGWEHFISRILAGIIGTLMSLLSLIIVWMLEDVFSNLYQTVAHYFKSQ